MSSFEVKLPDVGEGVAEAELVSWSVAVGDEVTGESTLAEVMTDKATVEVACPVAGTVLELHGEPGDTLAVGSVIVVIDTAEHPVPGTQRYDEPAAAPPDPADAEPQPAPEPAAEPTQPTRVAAAPAVRERARALGIDLASVPGSGPGGRVVHADLDRLLTGGTSPARPRPMPDHTTVEPVRGLRRKIAQRLTSAWTEIPHITYVDAVDVTEVEALRQHLNQREGTPRLTLLPFVLRAIALACADHPTLNATFDSTAEELTLHDAVHVGIATQTENGLVVPVVRDAGSRSLDDLATEISRVAEAARTGDASRQDLSGSTITVTSLGALGGLVTTPLINQPEVAIVGVNKIETRPVWSNGAFLPRQVMNLSSSFDHRIVDGWDAATFIQRIKELLELPALLFVDLT